MAEEVCAIVKERETRVIRFRCSRRNSIIKIEFRNWIPSTTPTMRTDHRFPFDYIQSLPLTSTYSSDFLIRDFLVPTNRSQTTLRLRLIDQENRNAIKCWSKKFFYEIQI